VRKRGAQRTATGQTADHSGLVAAADSNRCMEEGREHRAALSADDPPDHEARWRGPGGLLDPSKRAQLTSSGGISEMTGLLAGLYAVVLTTAFVASRVRPLSTPAQAKWPWATTIALIIVGIPTLAQFTVAPWLLEGLERNWTLIGRGQVWRLLTSLVVQDGGLVGAIFNLVALALIGFAAEKVWGARRWAAIALAGAVGAQLWGKIVQPMGAGNSVAVFSLAASLAVLAVLQGVGPQRLLGLVSLVGAAVLLIIGDIHGGAATIGAVLGFAFVRAVQRAQSQPG
jgi:membrane associated rhomboid family serine protease